MAIAAKSHNFNTQTTLVKDDHQLSHRNTQIQICEVAQNGAVYASLPRVYPE